jgi:hypothetical protein
VLQIIARPTRGDAARVLVEDHHVGFRMYLTVRSDDKDPRAGCPCKRAAFHQFIQFSV